MEIVKALLILLYYSTTLGIALISFLINAYELFFFCFLAFISPIVFWIIRKILWPLLKFIYSLFKPRVWNPYEYQPLVRFETFQLSCLLDKTIHEGLFDAEVKALSKFLKRPPECIWFTHSDADRALYFIMDTNYKNSRVVIPEHNINVTEDGRYLWKYETGGLTIIYWP